MDFTPYKKQQRNFDWLTDYYLLALTITCYHNINQCYSLLQRPWYEPVLIIATETISTSHSLLQRSWYWPVLFTATEIMISTSVNMISTTVIHCYRDHINQSVIATETMISTSVIHCYREHISTSIIISKSVIDCYRDQDINQCYSLLQRPWYQPVIHC